VTETDLAVESLIQATIESAFPGHAVLSEETRPTTGLDGWVWVLDPIDGTKNFSMGIPFFCINLALCLDGVPQLGITRDPVRREEIAAVRGRGLRVNGRRVTASARSAVAESVIALDAGFHDSRGSTVFQTMSRLWPDVQAVRIPGSAALGIAYAACGRFDLFVHHFVYPWDIAAGILLVEEGGGRITDRDGQPATLLSDSVVAGGPRVHQDFFRLAVGENWRGLA
jgi:myo-inositol-1(or 4)-monophosphatase